MISLRIPIFRDVNVYEEKNVLQIMVTVQGRNDIQIIIS